VQAERMIFSIPRKCHARSARLAVPCYFAPHSQAQISGMKLPHKRRRAQTVQRARPAAAHSTPAGANYGRTRWRVRDAGSPESARPVPAAMLTLRNLQSGQIFSGVSSGEGVFRLFLCRRDGMNSGLKPETTLHSSSLTSPSTG